MSHDNQSARDKEFRAQMLADFHNALIRLRGLTMPQMAVYLEAICVAMIQQFFKADPIFTWEDDEDITRNRVWVGTEYPREMMEAKDMRPMIIVGVQGLQSSKAVINDTHRQGPMMNTAGVNQEKIDLVTVPIQIAVMSSNRTVSLFLGGMMYALFRTGAEFFRKAFQVNSVSAPQMGSPALVKDYPDYFIVPVSFALEVLPKWENVITEETFTDVVLSIRGIVDRSLMNVPTTRDDPRSVYQDLNP